MNDASLFTNGNRLRLRDQVDIQENTITALRGDFELITHDLGIITSVEGGVRFSQLEYQNFGNENNDITNFGDSDAENALATQIASECAIGAFPESDFLSEISGADGFITNSVTGVSTNTFATFDLDCSIDLLLANAQSGSLEDTPSGFTPNSADVEENTFAAYLQANYEATVFGLPARGNFGVRLVNTSVDSIGRRFEVTSEIDDDELELVVNTDNLLELETQSNSYTEILPSFSFVADLSDTVLFRAGVFRGLSRQAPSALSFGREIDDDEITLDANTTADDAINEILGNTQANGNAQQDALTSWNIDAAIEWYPNKDTILSLGGYYKKFQGGFEQVSTQETFEVDGIDRTALVTTTEISSDTSNLYGIEVTASHAFNYLPGFLGGFGAKVSYNYASSDFEFFDGDTGAGVSFDSEGVATEFPGFTDSAGLFGLSRNVGSAQLYWSGGAFDAQFIYKTRSQFFQQFTRTNTDRLRLIDDSDILEFRASYRLNDTIKLSFEALNILDEEREDFIRAEGNVSQTLSFGSRFFFGIQAKL